MATQAHCAFCIETLVASLEHRQPLSLRQIQEYWALYHSSSSLSTESVDADENMRPDPETVRPAAISRLLSGSPRSGSRSGSGSGSATPSSSSEEASKSSSQTSLSGSSVRGQAQRRAAGVPVADEAEDAPLFVTWNTLRGGGKVGGKALRGCIGTFQAQVLEEGLREYALTSALNDTRFDPVTASELPRLECAVTLLTDFETAADALDWELGTHGLRIDFVQRGRRLGATYLPDVAREQGWTKEEAVVNLMYKAGWSGSGSGRRGGGDGDKEAWKKVELTVQRYQGRAVHLEYRVWRQWRDWVEREMASGK